MGDEKLGIFSVTVGGPRRRTEDISMALLPNGCNIVDNVDVSNCGWEAFCRMAPKCINVFGGTKRVFLLISE